jgi:hypothetical protein
VAKRVREEFLLEPVARRRWSVMERLVRLRRDPSAERRARTRIPLILEVSYAVSECRGTVEMGSGRTVDLCKSGLSFTADGPLFTGQKLDVSIDWPVLLDGSVRMRLIMSGKVVRTVGNVIALQIRRYEFRTRRLGLSAASASR